MNDGILRHLTELVVIFVGVAMAFAVENYREDLNEREVEKRYLAGFRHDLKADAEMLRNNLAARELQLQDARTALSFFEGRKMDTDAFFSAFYAVLHYQQISPNDNTMTEVLNTGSLRLISSEDIRTSLLELRATYQQITVLEDHMARDFDQYLYDPTFKSVPIRIVGPWEDSEENLEIARTVTGDISIENGLRLAIINIEYPHTGLLVQLTAALAQVEKLQKLLATG